MAVWSLIEIEKERTQETTLSTVAMDLSKEDESLQQALLSPSREHPPVGPSGSGTEEDDEDETAEPLSSFHHVSFNFSNYLLGPSSPGTHGWLDVLERLRFVLLAAIVFCLYPAGYRSYVHFTQNADSSFQPIPGSPTAIAQEALALAYDSGETGTFVDPMNPPLVLIMNTTLPVATPDDDDNTTALLYNPTFLQIAQNFSVHLLPHLNSLCWSWPQHTPKNECEPDDTWLRVTSYFSLQEAELPRFAQSIAAAGSSALLLQVEYTIPQNQTRHRKQRVLELMEKIDEYYRQRDYWPRPPNSTVSDDDAIFHVSYTGIKYFASDLALSTRHDIRRMDFVVLPLALVLMGVALPKANPWLLWIIPVFTMLTSISLWSIIMRILGRFLQISTFTPTIMMSLTLGMGIDYTLFLLSRYLEEIQGDGYRPKAIHDMIAGSGKVIVVSGLTLSFTFLGLVWLPLGMLKSVGIGAAVAIVSSIGVNLVMVPVLLMTSLGRSLVLRSADEPADDDESKRSMWVRFSQQILHPYKGIIVLLFLLQLIVPIAKHARDIKSSISFDMMLPAKSPALQTYQALSETLGPGSLNPYKILLDGRDANITMTSSAGFDVMHKVISAVFAAERDIDFGPGSTAHGAFDQLVALDFSDLVTDHHRTAKHTVLNGISIVRNIPIPYEVYLSAKYCLQLHPCPMESLAVINFLNDRETSSDEYATMISATIPVNPFSDQGVLWLDRMRTALDAVDTPEGVHLYLDGPAAIAHDAVDAVYRSFPTMIVLTCVVVFLLMGYVFGSVVPPLRSLVSVATTLSCSFGLAALVFDENSSWKSPHHRHGETSAELCWLVPVMTFSILVGLSLDYDVFLVSRVLEFRREGYCHKSSIDLGLDSTGGVITAAGVIMAVAFGSLQFSSNPVVYQWSFLLTVAVLLDTFVVRTTIVPILMSLGGSRLCWWPQEHEDRLSLATFQDPNESSWMQRLEETSEYESLPVQQR